MSGVPELEKARLVRPDDAAAIALIYAPVVRDTAISFEVVAPTPEQMRERIVAISDRMPWLVSEGSSGRVNGYVYASSHRERAAYQWSVDTTAYVRDDERGKGIGKSLYRAMLARLSALGYYQAFAGIALPNEASVALHESVGFTPVGVYRNVASSWDAGEMSDGGNED